MTDATTGNATGKQVFLHIGAQKTASTMLSRVMRLTQQEIKQRGVKLLFRDMLLDAPFLKHVNSVIQQTAPPDAPLPHDARENLERLLAGRGDRVLMSSEAMFRRLHPLYKRLDPYDFFENIGAGLKLLRRELPQHGFHVILYVREQTSFLESTYTQLVHMGRTMSFDDFIKGKIPDTLSWRRVCDEIVEALGPGSLSVRPFEIIRDMGGEKFFYQFLETIGITDAAAMNIDPEAFSGRSANRSFSDVAMQMAHIATPVVSPQDMKRLRKFLQNNFSNEHYPRPQLLSPDQRTAMKDHYRNDNIRLFETHMPSYDPKKYGYA